MPSTALDGVEPTDFRSPERLLNQVKHEKLTNDEKHEQLRQWQQIIGMLFSQRSSDEKALKYLVKSDFWTPETKIPAVS